ncbi:hypothetical protein LJB86_02280 [Deltaproteobacteria bacterium OttesenSCG-928-M10]|nr:hypothetical protein [Deltaproteobacteria bacterium OttesenSCG-928-M10]
MRNCLRCFVLASLALSLFILPSCAFRSYKAGAFNSYVSEDCPASALPLMAEHLAGILAAHYPPGHTSLFLNLTGHEKDGFGPALETALRSRGFVISAEKNGQTVKLAYILDRLDEDHWYARLSLTDGLGLAQTYRVAGDDLEIMAVTKTGLNGSGHVQ